MKVTTLNTILKLMTAITLTAGLLLVFAMPAHAQNRLIRGKVTDENNQPVEGAAVRVEGTDMVVTFNLKTNRRGEFMQILGSQLATYRVVVRKDGYMPASKENLRPGMGEEATADFQLEPGYSTLKLPFEMTDSDRADIQRKLEDQKKRQKFSAEVKNRFDQGVTLYDAGQFTDALAEFSAALAIDSKQPGILARIGDCYLRLDRNEEALDAYNKALELDPGDGSLYAQKGVVLGRMGRAEESQEMFTKSAQLDPSGAGLNFFNLGATMYNAGEMDKAADAFRRSVAADPNYAESYYLLGMSLANDESMFPEAIKAFRRYIEIGKRAEQVQISKDMINALEGM